MSKWKCNKDLFGIRSEDIEHDPVMEQIVREHNAHEELVNVCELSKEVFENIRNGKTSISDVLLCIENIESALKKAKGNE